MLLFVGLGNPDLKYAKNRHNIGFMAIDAIAEAYSFDAFKTKHHGLCAEGRIEGEKVMLLKPSTYMNKSGVSVADAAHFYKLDGAQIVVFYDELDLPHGKLRMRMGGGTAGHNGLRSINAHMGAAFRRARLGIGHPGDKSKVTGHVLGDFAKRDEDWLIALLASVSRHAGLLVDGADATYQTRVVEDMNAVLTPKKNETPPPSDKDSSNKETK
jgi:PTH1 family peptidyl-tRNA hydrolase